jgi:hypothetical protein
MQDKTLATFATVQVRSWDYQTKTATISTWQAQKTQNQPRSGGRARAPTMSFTKAQTQGATTASGPTYIVRRSGLTQAQADELAKKTLADVTLNERSFTWTGPAILNLDVRGMAQISGTQTAFDQSYEISEATRTFSWESTAMTLHGKSASPQQMVAL